MKSLGEELISAREAKGWNLEHIERETNIAKKYLSALESENFSAFSAEAYATGFLRNYGEYLGLDVNRLLTLYRTIKIQEQAVPMDALLHRKPVWPKILIAALSVLFAAGIVLLIISTFKKEPAAVSNPVITREEVEYTLTENNFEQRFYLGDTLLVTFDNVLYKLTLSNIGDIITIQTPEGEVRIDLSAPALIDFNNDGTNDLSITAADFTKGNADVGALLHFEILGNIKIQNENELTSTQANSSQQEITLPVVSAVTIFSSVNPHPFTLQISFQGYCMFRWEILREPGRQARNEQYFSRGQELSVQAQNGVRLWVSNAASAKIQTIGGGQTIPINLGSNGEVVVADIQWIRDEGSRYKLVLQRLEN